MSRSILLIEDEPGLVLTLKDRLTREGYEVDSAQDGNLGLAAAMRGQADLIILDLMLPGKSGLDICRDLRQKGIETPILMLTARGQTVDKVLGLKLGADDYMTKPFEMPELLARVEVLMRAILRAAFYELRSRPDVPARVAVTEYVDVAAAFFGPEESGMINAVLDALARQTRPAEFASEP